jgi:hypothetical protein
VEAKAPGEFERRKATHVGVVFEVKLYSEEMLEQVLVGTRIKWRAKAIG